MIQCYSYSNVQRIKYCCRNLENSSTSPHPTELKHTRAPDGALYTDIDKARPAKLTGNTDHKVRTAQ